VRPTSRLDLLLVPRDPSVPAERARRLLESLQAEGVVDPAGAPGPAADRWIPGGFARLWLDDPGVIGFWANRQGGFTVRCPATDAPLVEAFSRALAAWRAGVPGQPPEVACASCGSAHPADALVFRPEAAFGPWALVTGHAQAAELSEEGRARAEVALGSCAVVLRRG
jgi:hypothetical protein